MLKRKVEKMGKYGGKKPSNVLKDFGKSKFTYSEFCMCSSRLIAASMSILGFLFKIPSMMLMLVFFSSAGV